MEYEYEKKNTEFLIEKGFLIRPDKCPLCGKGRISLNKYTKGKNQYMLPIFVL